ARGRRHHSLLAPGTVGADLWESAGSRKVATGFRKKSCAQVKSGIAPGNSISPATRQALGCGGLRGPISRAPDRLLRHAKRKPRPAGRGKVNPPAVGLEPVEDLVGPETLEPVQRLVECRELLGIDSADLLNRSYVLLVERLDDVTHLAALVGQLDADRAPVNARTLVIEERHLHQLLEVVRNVRPEIVTARAQLTGRQFL